MTKKNADLLKDVPHLKRSSTFTIHFSALENDQHDKMTINQTDKKGNDISNL